jgi:hypothetical protein
MPYVAGQVLTAAELNSWTPTVALKTAGLARNSTAVLAADPDLVVTLLANCRYRINVNLGFDGPAAADISIGFARTGTVGLVSSSTGREYVGPDTGTASVVSATSMRVQKATTATPDGGIAYGSTGGVSPGVIREEFWVDAGASGGTLTLTWAQAVSNAGNTTLTGAMTAQRVA